VNPRALLAILWNAEKALDLMATARQLGLLERLDAGPVSLTELADVVRARPLRMYKFLDGLESLGLVRRIQPRDELASAEYVSVEPLAAAAEAVLGERSIERDRDRYPWRELQGRLPEVLRGGRDATFAWPPKTADDVRGFEASMAAGCPPIIEALRDVITRGRWLDVGGGDGTVAEALAREHRELVVDVYNLPAVEPLVRARRGVGFVGGDFFAETLPTGYDTLSFVRVLHDWPEDAARALLVKATAALAPGAQLVVCEEFRTPDRLAVQFFWTYFLIGVDACVSRLREVEWYTAALSELGYVDIRVIPGAFDVVVATRGSRRTAP